MYTGTFFIETRSRARLSSVPFFIRAISDFFYYRPLGGISTGGHRLNERVREREKIREIERGREEKEGDKSADKRVRFIGSLILFIDTRFARLRSQRLRRRNSVRKIRSRKNASYPLPRPVCVYLLSQFHRSRSYISFARACVDNIHTHHSHRG